MNAIHAADYVYNECVECGRKERETKKPMDPRKRFAMMMEKFTDFARRYVLVFKFMAVYFLYDRPCFERLIERFQRQRPQEEALILEMQGQYLKEMLNKLAERGAINLNKIQVNNVVNAEVGDAQSQITKINNMQKRAEQEMASQDKTNQEDEVKELIAFCIHNHTSPYTPL